MAGGSWAAGAIGPFVRSRPRRLALLLCLTFLVGCLAAAAATEGRGGLGVRLVLSSQAGSRALALNAGALNTQSDRWRGYLASERICPGRERTDLPFSKQVAALACLINYARDRRGVHRLVVTPVLSAASSEKARDIVRCESFAHNPCGGAWTSAARSVGYKGLLGENLYLASGGSTAPLVAIDAWLNSPAHRENLFGPEWRELGLAVLARKQLAGYRDVTLWVSTLGDR